MKKINILLILLLFVATSIAQPKMKKPSVMVVPSKAWCKKNGFTKTFNNQGSIENHPNFRKAFEDDVTLKQVLVAMSGVMKQRGFTMKMLEAQLDKVDKKMADQNMRMSTKTGGTVMLSPTDMLNMTAKADIRMEVTYTVNRVGPKKSIQFTLEGLDAGMGTLVAEATGNGEPSFAAGIPELMEEAVSSYMDGFCNKVMDHFIDIHENGREINLNINVWDDWGEDLETEDYGDDELMIVIEDWVSDNTVNNNFNLSDATESYMVFEMTRIANFYTDKNGKQKPQDAGRFGKRLRDYLKDFGLESKGERSGLTEYTIWIGHK
ncbi:MAG: DUF6175 family protein [Bacteroidota bacterium]|nr:DUF6175 family protein [Bacteroidota bacterium]